MSKIDIAIALILILGAYLGYKRGFLMELFFLLALILGIFTAFKLMGWGMEYLHKHFNADETFLPYISFFIIFVLVVLLVTFLGKSIKDSMDKTFLGKVDAIAGAFLGLVKFAFCLSIALWLVDSVRIKLPSGWTQGSFLYPATAHFAPDVAAFLGGFLPFFKEVFS